MAQRMIKMFHPAIENSEREVTESAFDLAWSQRGWQRSADPEDGTSELDEPADNPVKGKKSKDKSGPGTGEVIPTPDQ